ncbi:MAG TPA: DUF87 domain-containing protein [Ktedonobacteraceae bacterium]|nr:DUF87 domain-containing protein [Ktedonobacteraceae bacterium]
MRKPKLASVQQYYVRAREVQGDVLCLWVPLSPTRRAYRAILDISPINFLLKAEEEQAALLDRYAALLKALTFPVQILIRNQPLDLRPYLARVRTHACDQVETHASDKAQERVSQDTGIWPELAADLEIFLRHLGSRRTLLTRKFYLVIPAPELRGPARRSPQWRKKHHRARNEALRLQALQDLAVRVEMIESQLQALGLLSRRLSGTELAQFYQSCLTPERYLHHPLGDAQLRVVGGLPKVKKVRAGRAMPHRITVDKILLSSRDELLADTPRRRFRFPGLSYSLRKQRPKGRTASVQRSIPQKALPPSDIVHLADLLAPGSIQEFRDAVCVSSGIHGVGGKGEEWVHGISVTAFPREVSMGGWLAPLFLHDDILEIVFHLHPQNSARMLRQLKNRRSGYASTKAFNRRYGRLDEPEIEVATSDVLRIMSKLASGEERLFEVSLLILVRAHDRQTLAERSERVASLLQTVLLDSVAYATTFEHGQALRSALPECRDELGRTITLDTSSLATTFPFISNALSMPEGTLLGVTDNGEPVLLDPWHPSLENPHCFLGGVSGSGKSFTGKLWIERSLLVNGRSGERVWVIDPDSEYLHLARAMNGCVVRIAPGSAQHLNPFDLLPPGYDLDTYLQAVKQGDRLAEKIRDLRRLLDVMLADKGTTLSMRERAFLDRVLYETYRRVGISADPRTHYHQPPLLRDLSEVIKSGACGLDEFDFVLRLSQYTEGSLSALFSAHTNVDLDSHLLVWDIRDMGEDYLPIGMFLIADGVWTQAIYQSHVRRALYIDEAATLIERVEGGAFLADLSRRARKRYLRLVAMAQNPESFVQNEHGAVVAANSATKILKRQDRTSVKAVASRFGLTHGEAERLLVLAPNEALALCGDRRVLLTSQVSLREQALMTTNPVELAELHPSPRQATHMVVQEDTP